LCHLLIHLPRIVWGQNKSRNLGECAWEVKQNMELR
jgi:hypothetical protein